jgi:hypothetical protein
VWSGSNPDRVHVSANGLVVGLDGGSATIAASSEGASAAATIRVTFRVAAVTVDQGDLTLVPGGTLQLSATPHDPGGNPLGGRATSWSSGDPSVLRVSPTGSVEALAEGAATLTATVEGVSGTITVRVERLAFVSVSASECTTPADARATDAWSAGASTTSANWDSPRSHGARAPWPPPERPGRQRLR